MTKSGRARVAVVGASGFVGRAVGAELRARGHTVVAVKAPRLRARGRTVEELRDEPVPVAALAPLCAAVAGADVVVNAAGVSDAAGADQPVLLGANALLPRVLAEACREAGVRRLVHISSAAVQGRAAVLDESPRRQPFSPYSSSKAMGEQLVEGRAGVVVFRPTSVHGTGRTVTRSLVRLAGSRWSSVEGAGARPTPQVLVTDVARAVAEAALGDEVPSIVLQPAGGLTTRTLLRLLGGREPHRLPAAFTRPVLATLRTGGRFSPAVAATARRAEMLWRGQAQVDGWLTAAGWSPATGPRDWARLAEQVEAERRRTVVMGVTAPASLTLMTGWPRFLSEHVDVHVVVGASAPPVPGATVHVLPMRRQPSPLSDLVALARWLLLLARLRPAVVLVGTPKAGALGTIAARILRVPRRVYLLRGLRVETTTGPLRRLLLVLERLTVACATDVLSVSGSLSGEAVRLGLGPPEKFVVLGSGSSNGVDLSRFRPPTAGDAAAARCRFGFAGGGPVVGFVGRITADKGVHTLAEAMVTLARSTNAQLLLVGAEEEPGLVEGLTRRLLCEGVAHRFVDHVDDTAPLYHAMDVLCLPSLREGFPTVVLEAAASGVPAVCSDATGCRDAVVDGVTGSLFRVGDVDDLAANLHRLLADRATLHRMGAAARRRAVREFDQRRVWRTLLQFLDDAPEGATHDEGGGDA